LTITQPENPRNGTGQATIGRFPPSSE